MRYTRVVDKYGNRQLSQQHRLVPLFHLSEIPRITVTAELLETCYRLLLSPPALKLGRLSIDWRTLDYQFIQVSRRSPKLLENNLRVAQGYLTKQELSRALLIVGERNQSVQHTVGVIAHT